MIKNKAGNWLLGKETFLAFIISLFAILRLPSVVEPYWYGDEGVYEVIGRALAHGRVLYSQIWDNKPPVLYLIYAVFSGDQFYARLASLVIGIFSLILIFIVANKIFKKNLSVFVSTVFFAALFATPFLEGNIANAENFMLLPILGAFYLLFIKQGNRQFNIFFGGLLLSLAFLTKIVAVFDFAAFSVGLLGLKFFDTISFSTNAVQKEIASLKSAIIGQIIFVAAFLLPILITVIYFFSKGALSDFYRATFSQNVGYVGYGNYFIFPMGLLFLKLFLLLFAILAAFRFRKILGEYGFLIFIWLSFSIFNAFFSARPYTHYLLVLLPSLSLFVAYIFENKSIRLFNIALLIVILFFVNHNFKFYTKIFSYYQNYLSFTAGKKSVVEYQNFFDTKAARDMDIAKFLQPKLEANDGIFLWGDDPQVYYLSGRLPPGRYIVSYHITFYKNAIDETRDAIAKSSVRYIIQTKDTPEISNFLSGYVPTYKIDDVVIYEKQL